MRTLGPVGSTVIFLGVAAATIWQAYDAYQLVSTGVHTTGKVVSTVDGTHPHVECKDQSGNKFGFTEHGFSANYRTDQEVKVLYFPKNPSDSGKVDEFFAVWGGVCWFGFMSAAMIIPVVYALISKKEEEGSQ